MQAAEPRCVVNAGQKVALDPALATSICREIGRAMEPGTSAQSIDVQVRRSHLRAQVLLIDGTRLPDIGFSVSDAALSEQSIRDFAEHVAGTVKSAVVSRGSGRSAANSVNSEVR
ncbi:hypothetical protein G7077_10055 [Sphingomonas piscis]|uniref:Uncharacterized protein n=1 Tax=Sphingomonas piscis TaxID=2714943 RepID=A0A6G7YR23_9SPHN|nr:hypothetical protein [Sphingomonas piscis]QIK79186.1 hypothetical protein G7077_10055 [Sphingomonas piscis]